MSKATPDTKSSVPTLLEEADALRQRGNVAAARQLALRLAAAGGPQSGTAERLLTLTGFPRVILAFAGAALAILLALVTLASLRS